MKGKTSMLAVLGIVALLVGGFYLMGGFKGTTGQISVQNPIVIQQPGQPSVSGCNLPSAPTRQ